MIIFTRLQLSQASPTPSPSRSCCSGFATFGQLSNWSNTESPSASLLEIEFNKIAGLLGRRLLVLLPALISNIVSVRVLLVAVFITRTIVTGIADTVTWTISPLSHNFLLGPQPFNWAGSMSQNLQSVPFHLQKNLHFIQITLSQVLSERINMSNRSWAQKGVSGCPLLH